MTTKVSGGYVLSFLSSEILAHRPGTSYDSLNSWVKALVHLQKAQGVVTLVDGSLFGDTQHIRQYMPLCCLLASMKERQRAGYVMQQRH